MNDMGQFVIHPLNLNETTISDGVATFSRSETTDTLIISGRKLYFATYLLDACGRIEAIRQKLVKPLESITSSRSWGSGESKTSYRYESGV